jgi:hypothetical protein
LEELSDMGKGEQRELENRLTIPSGASAEVGVSVSNPVRALT